MSHVHARLEEQLPAATEDGFRLYPGGKRAKLDRKRIDKKGSAPETGIVIGYKSCPPGAAWV
jgi:hypothetical protein